MNTLRLIISSDVANTIIDELSSHIKKYGYFTVQDVELLTTNLTKYPTKHGWNSMDGVRVVKKLSPLYFSGKGDEMYQLFIPEPKQIITHNSNPITNSFETCAMIIGFDLGSGEIPFMSVSIPVGDGKSRIINILHGDDAIDAYNKLVTVKRVDTYVEDKDATSN